MNLSDFLITNSLPTYKLWYFIKDTTHKKTPTSGGFNKNDSLEMIDKKSQYTTMSKPVIYYDFNTKTNEPFSENESKTVSLAHAVFLNHTDNIYCIDVDEPDITSMDDFIAKYAITTFNECPWVKGNTKGIHIYVKIYNMVAYTSEIDVFSVFKGDLLKTIVWEKADKEISSHDIKEFEYNDIKEIFSETINRPSKKIETLEEIKLKKTECDQINEVQLYVDLGLSYGIFEKFSEKEGYTKWLNIGFLIKDALHEQGKKLWVDVCKVLYHDKYDGQEESEQFYDRLNKSIKSDSKKPLTVATLIKYYKDADHILSKKIIANANGILKSNEYNVEQHKEYQQVKHEQETKYKLSFIRSIVSYSYLVNDKIMFFDQNQMKQILNTVILGGSPFFDSWCVDKTRKEYEKVDIVPHDRECPPNVLNLWSGFAAEKLTASIVNINRILDHIRILCGRNEEYYDFFMMWLANFFQYPSRTSVMPFIQGIEGCGKGIFLAFLSHVIGEDKFFTCEDMENELMGQFNGHLRDVMFVNIDEIDFKTTSKFIERIKSMITRKTISINEKGQKRINIPHYIKYLTTANPKYSFHISENDRRIAPISSSTELKGNDEYFEDFSILIEDKNVQYSFYKYMMAYKTKEQIQGSDIPETELRQESKIMSRDSIEDFISEFKGTTTSNDFFEQYKDFMKKSNLQCNISLKSFQMKAKSYYEKYEINMKTVDKIYKDNRIQGRCYYKGEFDETVYDKM